MTYKNYKEAFDRFINNHFRKALIESDDPELRLYGQLLYENTLSPHGVTAVGTSGLGDSPFSVASFYRIIALTMPYRIGR